MTGEKILIVDDEEDIRNILEQAFIGAGYSVSLSASGEKALEVLEQENIHVFFLDLKLPGMDGMELCRQIRKDRPMSIIFAVTGYASLFELRDCREAGFDDYFIKPVNMEDLYQAAHHAFEKLGRWKKR